MDSNWLDGHRGAAQMVLRRHVTRFVVALLGCYYPDRNQPVSVPMWKQNLIPLNPRPKGSHSHFRTTNSSAQPGSALSTHSGVYAESAGLERSIGRPSHPRTALAGSDRPALHLRPRTLPGVAWVAVWGDWLRYASECVDSILFLGGTAFIY